MDPLALEKLIARIEAGLADEAELAVAAQALSRWEAEFPLPLGTAVRGEAGTVGVDEVADVVDAVLGLHPGDGLIELQPGDGFLLDLGSALADEAGDIDISVGVLAAISGQMPLSEAVRDDLPVPVADAVRDEAGGLDVVAPVLDEAGLEDARWPIAEAVRDEAGEIDDARQVMAAIGVTTLPIAAAIHDEAGAVDVVDAVVVRVSPWWLSAMLDRALTPGEHRAAAARLAAEPGAGREMTALADVGRELRAALIAEAGAAPDLWHGVAAKIGIADPEAVPGWEGVPLAEALRDEAGAVSVVDEVLRRVERSAQGFAPPAPAPANRGFTYGAIALAAVALFTVVVGNAWFGGSPSGEAPIDRGQPLASLDFASPDEITIDDLEYGQDANVQVITTEGENAAMIIWVEGETL